MIGIDTNVLVRFLVKDDAHQAARAVRVLQARCTSETPGWINRVVLCELVWVLESAYRYDRSHVAGVVESLLRADDLVVEDSNHAWQALNGYRQGLADFADLFVGATNAAAVCQTTLTFDRDAARTNDFELV